MTDKHTIKMYIYKRLYTLYSSESKSTSSNPLRTADDRQEPVFTYSVLEFLNKIQIIKILEEITMINSNKQFTIVEIDSVVHSYF